MSKYKVGEVIEVKVTALEKYGAFVKTDNNYTGLIHISEITGGFIQNINDYFNIGDTLSARIMNIDEEKKQLKLSLKGVRNRFKFLKGELKETELGFSLLEELLPIWLKEKQNELKNKKNN
jgi:general stress protein 13